MRAAAQLCVKAVAALRARALAGATPGRGITVEDILKRLAALAAISLAAFGAAALPAMTALAQTPTSKVEADAKLKAAVANPARADARKVRDAHRHPAETLAFFGIKPNMTVIEIAPGSGYYAEILAPYLSQGGGKYIATGSPIASTSRRSS